MIRTLINLSLKRPILAIYDVTKLCNQRCLMCNIWKTTSNDMDLNQLEDEVKKLKRFGIRYVFIQGGEPLMRRDILDVTDLFIKHRIKPTIITNGILLTELLAREIAKRRCNLAISIDSMDRDLFAKLRGADKLPHVLENIEKISGMKRKGNWSITTTITGLSSLDDIKKLEAFAADHGLMFAIRPYIFVKGVAGKKNEELMYHWDDVAEIFGYMSKKAKQNNFLAYLIYKEHIRYIKGEGMHMCDAARYSFLMTETGVKSPCIEFTNYTFNLDTFREDRKTFCQKLEECNRSTPCFYNDAREIGVLWRNKWVILLNAPKIIAQLIRYGNFF
ncbi:MAG: radical SAM protein [Clostridiaceae bacterium]|jgi:MoaA/NifB/PqqE/SkfB family radical SAM enzyme|nr:radical SAM protein [Clostridiaceae bacterium]